MGIQISCPEHTEEVVAEAAVPPVTCATLSAEAAVTLIRCSKVGAGVNICMHKHTPLRKSI